MAAFVYLETAINSGVFNCRGELDPSAEPASFARLMGNSGLRVIVTDGSEVGKDKATVEAQGLKLRATGAFKSGIQDVAQRLVVVEE